MSNPFRLVRGAMPPTPKAPDTEIQLTITHDPQRGVVVVNFAQPVLWLAMRPEEAVSFAKGLMEHALKASAEAPPPEPTPEPLQVEPLSS